MTPDPAQWLQRPEPPLPDIGPDPEPPDPDDVPPTCRSRTGNPRATHRGMPRPSASRPCIRRRWARYRERATRHRHEHPRKTRRVARHRRNARPPFRGRARCRSIIEEKPLGALHIGFRVDGHPASLTVAFDADAFAALEQAGIDSQRRALTRVAVEFDAMMARRARPRTPAISISTGYEMPVTGGFR